MIIPIHFKFEIIKNYRIKRNYNLKLFLKQAFKIFRSKTVYYGCQHVPFIIINLLSIIKNIFNKLWFISTRKKIYYALINCMRIRTYRRTLFRWDNMLPLRTYRSHIDSLPVYQMLK